MWGVKRSTASQVRRLEVGCNGRVFEGTKSHRGCGVPSKPIQGVRLGRVLGCRGTLRHNVQGWLLDFTQPPGTVKGVVSDGGSNRWGSG